MQRLPVLGAVLVVAAACQDATSPSPIATAPARANAATGAATKDYIVVLRDDESDPDIKAKALVKVHGGSLKHVYKKALKGFAVADLSDEAVAAIRATDGVAYVEADQIMTAVGTQSNPPSWGLDRIDQRNLPLDQSFTYANSGGGVTAYIVDTGINGGSNDFTGRVGAGYDFIDNDSDPTDCHGHGTHVAGTVAGTTYGIAKSANIVAVRVLNCQGSGANSVVIAGVDWVAANAVTPAVAIMSLGGGFSSALNAAVARAVDAGVTFAVAAGNSNANACNYSPSSEPKAITVGATTSSDAKASYSNTGSCVDIQAPGSGITSDWIGSATATNTISGTSMASPHVAGAAALILGATGNGSLTPAQVTSQLVANATSGVVTGLPLGTVNKLLYIGSGGGGGTEPPPTPPSVTVTKSCNNSFTCTFSANVSNGTAPITYAWKFADEASNRTAQSFSRTLEPRTNYSFTLVVTAANGQANTSGTVTCNPKKCQ
jgi:subtilisin family serine protease